jgi:hypothetical protein
MGREETASAEPTVGGVRWRGWVLLGVGAIFLLVVIAGTALRIFGYDIAKSWLESPAGAQVAGRELGKAIKVDGTFAPIHLEGWTLVTDSFQSQGWPGEAIGSLDADHIRAVFDPSAVWKGAWRFSSIDIDHAVIRLLKPNDALKRPVAPKKPKPWYAFFLPDHFECGPIISQKSDIQFSFQGVDAGIHDAHVQADLIGKDLKYTATSGILDFPYLPPVRVVRLEMLVTRPSITIYTAQLAGIDPQDPARLTLSGRVGMREDKSINAIVDVNEMSIEKILPENLRSLIHGNITGKLVWHRNAAGDELSSEGDLKLTGARIDNISVFKVLTQLHNNPDLQDFVFDEASCHYRLAGGKLYLELKARDTGKFHLTGTVVYDLKTKMTDLDLVVDELPLKVWMPVEFKPRYDGVAKAILKWDGQLDSAKDSTGTVWIDLNGTQILDPVLLRKFLSSKGFQAPEQIHLDKAEFTFNYANDIFRLSNADLVAPGFMTAQLTGSLTKDKSLVATMDWQGITLENWIPIKLAKLLTGTLDGRVELAVQNWQFGDGSYGGNMHLLRGALHYTSFQSTMARFLNEPTLLVMPLQRTQLSWKMAGGNMDVNGIDIRAGDAIGIKGNFAVRNSTDLSGKLLVGIKPEYLTWLPGAQEKIFTRKDEGLVWTEVNLSGTVKKPGQDLVPRIIAQLKRHPLTILALGCKYVSWTVGDWFGEAEQWKRPEIASVKVGDTQTSAAAR